MGDRAGIVASLNDLAKIAYFEENYSSASRIHEEALTILQELGDRTGIAATIGNLGFIAYSSGDYKAARSLYDESLAIRLQVEDRLGITCSFENLASVSAVEGHPVRAAHLWGAAEALRTVLGAPMQQDEMVRHSKQTAIARVSLADDPTFDCAWEAGKAMSMEQAIALALEHAGG